MISDASVSPTAVSAVAPATLHADGPVLVFGGPYGNLQATRALLGAAARLGIPPSRTVCTGDTVAYGADPVATIDELRRAGVAVVRGNCEEQFGRGADDCGCGFATGSACDALSTRWFAHTDRLLDAETRGWMRGLPATLSLTVGGRRLLVLHGDLDRRNGFRFGSDGDRLDGEIARSGHGGVIGGHAGLPFTRLGPGGLWHNAGAIGLPANDGTARGWFSLLVPAGEALLIRHLPLHYDHDAAAAAMRTVGLPAAYADALLTGLWPSLDILPDVERAMGGSPLAENELVWRDGARAVACWPPAVARASPATPSRRPDPPERFTDPERTVTGETRGRVPFVALRTLWLNTGTLCNVACTGCYIESSPTNDRLVYLRAAEAARFLDEAERDHPALREIGFTGGEPFMNRDITAMIGDALGRGFRALVLTNAMRPMRRHEAPLLALRRRFGERLAIRVSLDHHAAAKHESLRGPRSWRPAIDGIGWLAAHGFDLAIAGRTCWDEPEAALRDGYRRLFAALGLTLDADDPARLVLFPEMRGDPNPVPEITERCWGIVGKASSSVMCASSRMVVHRKGAPAATVASCTLLPYDERFDLGSTLAAATVDPVRLNHPICAEFCVLGGGRCSAD